MAEPVIGDLYHGLIDMFMFLLMRIYGKYHGDFCLDISWGFSQ